MLPRRRRTPQSKKGRPLGGQECCPQNYSRVVLWRAPEAAEKTGTHVVVERPLIVVQATDWAFYDGEWRGDDRGRLWMVDRRTPAKPALRAALDPQQGRFWDEKGIVWRWNPEDEGKPKVTRAGDKPQPYPSWAAPTGGKSLTPWRRPEGAAQ